MKISLKERFLKRKKEKEVPETWDALNSKIDRLQQVVDFGKNENTNNAEFDRICAELEYLKLVRDENMKELEYKKIERYNDGMSL